MHRPSGLHRFLFPDIKAEVRAADAADDVAQLRDIVHAGDRRYDLVAQIKDGDENERQGNPAVLHAAHGGQKDHHENNAAGTQHRHAGEEDALGQTRDKSGQQDEEEQPPAAV